MTYLRSLAGLDISSDQVEILLIKSLIGALPLLPPTLFALPLDDFFFLLLFVIYDKASALLLND